MKRLREWRLRRFLTQRDLAERVGVPYQTVQRWENGTSFPRPGHLRRLSEVLEASFDELVTPEEWQAHRSKGD